MNLETNKKVGILEGDLAMRKLLTELLEREGYVVNTLTEPGALKEASPSLDVVLASVPLLLGDSGLGIEEIKRANPDLGVVVVPASQEMERARELVNQGAFSLIQRPFQPWELLHRVRRACEMVDLKRQNQWLRRKDMKEPNTEMSVSIADEPTLEELEKRYIEVVLKKTGGRKDRASKLLGINRRTLYRKEREYGWVSKTQFPQTLARVAQ